MLFHTFCYIAATLLILWLRSESTPQQTDFSHAFKEALEEHFEQLEQAEAEMEEVEQPQPEQSKVEAIASDIWEEDITTSSPRYWVSQPKSLKPTLALMPAQEEVKPVAPTRKTTTKKTLEIDLNNLDAAALRKLCTQHQVNWRNFLGKGKHMKKATMIEQLQQKLVA